MYTRVPIEDTMFSLLKIEGFNEREAFCPETMNILHCGKVIEDVEFIHRIHHIIHDFGDETWISYDEYGYITNIRHSYGDMTEYEYEPYIDSYGKIAKRIIKETLTGFDVDEDDPSCVPNGVITYQYDDKNRLVCRNMPNGTEIQFRYDDKDRLVEMYFTCNGTYSTYKYDDNDKCIEQTDVGEDYNTTYRWVWSKSVGPGMRPVKCIITDSIKNTVVVETYEYNSGGCPVAIYRDNVKVCTIVSDFYGMPVKITEDGYETWYDYTNIITDNGVPDREPSPDTNHNDTGLVAKGSDIKDLAYNVGYNAESVARISICGSIYFYIPRSASFVKPTEDQIKNLHDTFCIDVEIFE